jgi:hypothetical protein
MSLDQCEILPTNTWTIEAFGKLKEFSGCLLLSDVLHTIYPGILKHLMDWVIPLDSTRFGIKFSPNPGLTPFTRPYTAVTPFQGKEMRMLSWPHLVLRGY